MAKKRKVTKKSVSRSIILGVGLCILCVGVVYIIDLQGIFSDEYTAVVEKIIPPRVLDRVAYDRKLFEVAHASTTIEVPTASSTASSTKHSLWPAHAVYPNVDALLPFKRIVAYYGNFYSTKMGVLGEYPEAEMLEKLKTTVAQWQAADPTTPVLPAIDYIAVTAQGSAGADGKYRFQMPDSQIDYAISLANQVQGIVVLDVQVGLSTLQVELPALEKYLKMPNVHLAIDPEFSMKTGMRPGTVIGTFDAVDVNYAANYLAGLVRENKLPPKVLIVHRFTYAMVTNSEKIEPLPEVQIVMDMDGWGSPSRKYRTYTDVIYAEPVQFTGFKLFYKNDILPPSTHMLTPAEVLKLKPQPLFIQYQ